MKRKPFFFICILLLPVFGNAQNYKVESLGVPCDEILGIKGDTIFIFSRSENSSGTFSMLHPTVKGRLLQRSVMQGLNTVFDSLHKVSRSKTKLGSYPNPTYLSFMVLNEYECLFLYNSPFNRFLDKDVRLYNYNSKSKTLSLLKDDNFFEGTQALFLKKNAANGTFTLLDIFYLDLKKILKFQIDTNNTDELSLDIIPWRPGRVDFSMSPKGNFIYFLQPDDNYNQTYHFSRSNDNKVDKWSFIPDNAKSLCFSPDEKHIYFSYNDTLHTVRIPHRHFFLELSIYGSDTRKPLNSEIYFEQSENNAESKQTDSKGCLRTAVSLTDKVIGISAPGYRYLTDTIKTDTFSEFEEVSRKLYLKPLVFDQSTPFNWIFFDHNDSKLSDRAKAEIKLLFNSLSSTDFYEIQITGFTDSLGSDAYNKNLAKKRAEAVANYLVMLGVKPEAVTALAAGKDHSTRNERKKRRVEYLIRRK